MTLHPSPYSGLHEALRKIGLAQDIPESPAREQGQGYGTPRCRLTDNLPTELNSPNKLPERATARIQNLAESGSASSKKRPKLLSVTFPSRIG